jgi:UDP-glucose 4-epimerase
VRAVRFFNVVGPRQVDRHGMVLPTFVGQALRGEPLTVHGDGSQRRSFCHVGDAVEALARLLDRAPPAGPPVNVGSAEELSIADLARLVLREVGGDVPLREVPHEAAYGARFVDVRRRVPDLTRLEELTGFRPATPIERTVRAVVAAARAAGAGGRAHP